MLCGRPEIQGALLISGIYDLEPVRHCYVNDKLGLDEAMAVRNSPILHLPRSGPPVWVAVGGAELSELRRQSSDYAQARQRAGLSGGFVEIPGADHFSILSELESASGRLSRIVSELASAQNR